MKVTTETVEKNLIRLEIESAPELIEEGLAYAFKKNARNFRVNGFRPGKAPRRIVEQIYGKEVLYNDAIEYVVSRDYYSAVEEQKLEVVSEPQKIDVKEFSPEKALFTLEVYVKPEVKLGAYKNLKVAKVSDEVTDADVDEAVKAEAEKNARMITVEDRPAALEDTVVIDFEGFIDGEAFEGGKGENFSLKLGSGQFIPGFEEQLVGVQPETDVTVNVTFPEDYHAKEYAGKAAEFKVHVHEIKKQELPEIDDEFASDVSKFETLAEYKADLKAKMTEQKAEEAKHAMQEEALRKAITGAEIDVPECMIHAAMDEEVHRMEHQLQMYGMNLDQYCQYMNVTREEFRERTRPQAEVQVRRELVLEEISKQEGIVATQEDIDKEIAEAAEYMKKTAEEVRALYDANPDGIQREIRLRKASALITDTMVPVEKAEEPAAEEPAEGAENGAHAEPAEGGDGAENAGA